MDIGLNMTHISDNRRITYFSRSDNVICMPSSNRNEILDQLLTSLRESSMMTYNCRVKVTVLYLKVWKNAIYT